MILPILFVVRAQFLMGTVCEIDARDPEPAFAEARRIEALISTWQEGSELSRLNRAEIAHASPEVEAMLATARAISAETGGAFDPWYRGGRVDEGGFGKGYALDRMLALLDGEAMINFGGQIVVRGAREVAIADPQHRDRPLLTVTLKNASISTSSNAERGAHIIDPATGKAIPARGSVSVIDASAFRADALSTALYVMGPERGLAWARAHNVVAIFITNSGEILWSRKP